MSRVESTNRTKKQKADAYAKSWRRQRPQEKKKLVWSEERRIKGRDTLIYNNKIWYCAERCVRARTCLPAPVLSTHRHRHRSFAVHVKCVYRRIMCVLRSYILLVLFAFSLHTSDNSEFKSYAPFLLLPIVSSSSPSLLSSSPPVRSTYCYLFFFIIISFHLL